jgi:hypothetical protein
MSLEIGQRINMRYQGKSVNAEIIETELLNPNDRHSYSKRDSNPIYKVSVRIPELKMLVSPHVEMTDDGNDEKLIEKLQELIAFSLKKGECTPM